MVQIPVSAIARPGAGAGGVDAPPALRQDPTAAALPAIVLGKGAEGAARMSATMAAQRKQLDDMEDGARELGAVSKIELESNARLTKALDEEKQRDPKAFAESAFKVYEKERGTLTEEINKQGLSAASSKYLFGRYNNRVSAGVPASQAFQREAVARETLASSFTNQAAKEKEAIETNDPVRLGELKVEIAALNNSLEAGQLINPGMSAERTEDAYQRITVEREIKLTTEDPVRALTRENPELTPSQQLEMRKLALKVIEQEDKEDLAVHRDERDAGRTGVMDLMIEGKPREALALTNRLFEDGVFDEDTRKVLVADITGGRFEQVSDPEALAELSASILANAGTLTQKDVAGAVHDDTKVSMRDVPRLTGQLLAARNANYSRNIELLGRQTRQFLAQDVLTKVNFEGTINGKRPEEIFVEVIDKFHNAFIANQQEPDRTKRLSVEDIRDRVFVDMKNEIFPGIQENKEKLEAEFADDTREKLARDLSSIPVELALMREQLLDERERIEEMKGEEKRGIRSQVSNVLSLHDPNVQDIEQTTTENAEAERLATQRRMRSLGGMPLGVTQIPLLAPIGELTQ